MSKTAPVRRGASGSPSASTESPQNVAEIRQTSSLNALFFAIGSQVQASPVPPCAITRGGTPPPLRARAHSGISIRKFLAQLFSSNPRPLNHTIGQSADPYHHPRAELLDPAHPLRQAASTSHRPSAATKLREMTDLNELINGVTGRGRRSIPVSAEITRTLSAEDLQEMLLSGNGQPVPSVKELHASHHKLAQVLAKGAKPAEASAITGYSTARIRQLRDDPQFQELLTHYMELDQQDWTDFQKVIKQRLADLSLDSLEVAHRRLQEHPDSFSAKDLAQIAELGLDRIGHGKTSTQQVAHTHSIDEEQLARIRAAKDAPANVSPSDRNYLVSLALSATEERADSEEAEGGEGSRSGLREEGRKGTSEAARTIIEVSSVD